MATPTPPTLPEDPGSNLNTADEFPSSIVDDVVADEWEDVGAENRWTKTTAGTAPTGPVDDVDLVGQVYTLPAANSELILQSKKQPIRLIPGTSAWFLWRIMQEDNSGDSELVVGLVDTETAPFTNGFNDGVFWRRDDSNVWTICYARNATAVADYVEGVPDHSPLDEAMTMLGCLISCDSRVNGKMNIAYYLNGQLVGHHFPDEDGPWDADLRLSIAAKSSGVLTLERAGRGANTEHLAQVLRPLS